MMPFYNLDMIISLGYRVKSRVSQTDQGSSLLANASAAGSLVLCFDFDGDSGFEGDAIVVLLVHQDFIICGLY